MMPVGVVLSLIGVCSGPDCLAPLPRNASVAGAADCTLPDDTCALMLRKSVRNTPCGMLFPVGLSLCGFILVFVGALGALAQLLVRGGEKTAQSKQRRSHKMQLPLICIYWCLYDAAGAHV